MLRLPKMMGVPVLMVGLATAWPTGAVAGDCDWYNWHYHYRYSSYYADGYREAIDLVAEASAAWPVKAARHPEYRGGDLTIFNPLDVEVSYEIRSRWSTWYTHSRSIESRKGDYTARPELFVKVGEGAKQRSYTLVGGRTYRFKRGADGGLELEDAGPVEPMMP